MSARTPYLTPEGKERELQYWAEARAERDALRSPPEGGRGYADPEIYALCDRLNALEGVCTLQSCAGHIVPSPDGGTCRYPGSLWLWLSEDMSRVFHALAYDLAAHPRIERAATLHQAESDGSRREVVTLEFKGAERGDLDESAAVIGAFFERLRAPVPPHRGESWERQAQQLAFQTLRHLDAAGAVDGHAVTQALHADTGESDVSEFLATDIGLATLTLLTEAMRTHRLRLEGSA